MNVHTFKQRVSAACDDRARGQGRGVTAIEAVNIATEVFAEARPKRRRRKAYAPPPPRPVGPAGWFAWFSAEFAKVAEDDPAHGQLLSAHCCRAFHMLPQSWQQRAQYECQHAAAQ